MSIEDGKDMRDFLKGNKEEHMIIKRNLVLLRYQVGVFSRELKRNLWYKEKRDRNRQQRIESYGLKYHSIEDLNADYVAGKVSDEEYFYQRKAYWLVYDDRGMQEKLDWLTEERDRYQRKLDALNGYCEQKSKETHERCIQRHRARVKNRNRMRRVRKKEKMEHRRELWKKYGIG